MDDADKPTGMTGKAPRPTARGQTAPPWGDAGPRHSSGEPPLAADDDPDDPDTMLRENRSPARGIVLAVAPALLVWAALIALVTKVL